MVRRGSKTSLTYSKAIATMLIGALELHEV